MDGSFEDVPVPAIHWAIACREADAPRPSSRYHVGLTEMNEPEDVGPNVFWDPLPPFANEIEAELEDGTRIQPVIGLNGRRLAFDRPLPWGTPIYRGDRVAWRVSEKYRDP